MRLVCLSLGLLLGLCGCSSEPTLADAQDYLHEGNPESALAAARRAAERAQTAEERLRLRRFAFKASLEFGASREAAQEYAHIRQLLGREDDTLLLELSTETFRLAGRSSDPARRLSALVGLGRLIRQLRAEGLARVRPLIMAGLGDREPEVRCAAIRAVLRLPNPQVALDLLAPRAQSEPHAVVRQAAVDAVATLLPALRRRDAERGASSSPWIETVSSLAVVSSRDADVEVRLAGLELLEALAPLGDASQRRTLLAALEAAVGNGHDGVARAAARVILGLDPSRALAVWRRAGATAPAEASFGRALALHTRTDDEGRDEVLADLQGPSYAKRLAAAQGLRGPAAGRCVRALLKRVEHDPAVPVRSAALEALLSVRGGRSPRVQLALRQVMRSPDDPPAARRIAFLALERLRPHTTAQLAEQLRRGDPALATDVARLLASKRDEAGQAALLAALEHDATRLPALQALAERGDPAVREVFLGLLQDRDAQVRVLAARGLSRCGEPQDRAQLVRALEDPRRNADLSAAAALLAIQDAQRGPAGSPGTRQ